MQSSVKLHLEKNIYLYQPTVQCIHLQERLQLQQRLIKNERLFLGISNVRVSWKDVGGSHVCMDIYVTLCD